MARSERPRHSALRSSIAPCPTCATWSWMPRKSGRSEASWSRILPARMARVTSSAGGELRREPLFLRRAPRAVLWATASGVRIEALDDEGLVRLVVDRHAPRDIDAPIRLGRVLVRQRHAEHVRQHEMLLADGPVRADAERHEAPRPLLGLDARHVTVQLVENGAAVGEGKMRLVDAVLDVSDNSCTRGCSGWR